METVMYKGWWADMIYKMNTTEFFCGWNDLSQDCHWNLRFNNLSQQSWQGYRVESQLNQMTSTTWYGIRGENVGRSTEEGIWQTHFDELEYHSPVNRQGIWQKILFLCLLVILVVWISNLWAFKEAIPIFQKSI